MNLNISGKFESDLIGVVFGLSGDEPEEVRRRISSDEYGGTTIGVTFNTFYPEINGGYYFNRHLLSDFQTALSREGLYFVLDELYDDHSLVPIECFGTLQEMEAYVLVTASEVVGVAVLWSFDAGGGDHHFRDKMILQIGVHPDSFSRLRLLVEKAVSKNGKQG